MKKFNIGGTNFVVDPSLQQYEMLTDKLKSFGFDIDVIKNLVSGKEVSNELIAEQGIKFFQFVGDPENLSDLLCYILVEEGSDFDLDNLKATKNKLKKIRLSQLGELLGSLIPGGLDSLKELFQSSIISMQANNIQNQSSAESKEADQQSSSKAS
jgi:hypothetical protein